MRTLFIMASIPCAVVGFALSGTGQAVTFAGDVIYTLGWALLQRGRR
jgi:hypothetical protein